jgi:hypothetical protein
VAQFHAVVLRQTQLHLFCPYLFVSSIFGG